MTNRAKLGISESTEGRWSTGKVLPPHLKIRNRCFYILSEIEDFIDRNRVEGSHAHTS